MFTGLVEAVRPIISAQPQGGGLRLRIDLGELAADAHLGDSIAVNGACLTISKLDRQQAQFDAVAETVRVSTVGRLKSGTMVNLERALRADARLGGHLVQGHVDGVGTVDRIAKGPDEYAMWIAAAPELMRQMIAKGSVAIDGVSLTIVAVEPKRFSVSLIPKTLTTTNLRQLKAGDKVNLEADLIGKWINKRLDEVLGSERGGMTLKKLQEHGFS